MTKKELKKLDFESACNQMMEEGYCITDQETLIARIKDAIDEWEYNLAIHLLQAIRDDDSEYYSYDYNDGTLDTPTSLKSIEDLEELL